MASYNDIQSKYPPLKNRGKRDGHVKLLATKSKRLANFIRMTCIKKKNIKTVNVKAFLLLLSAKKF